MDTVLIAVGALAGGFAGVSLGLSYKLKKLKRLFEDLSKSRGELYSLYVSKQKAISKLEKDLDETKRNNDDLNIQKAHLQMTMEGLMQKVAELETKEKKVLSPDKLDNAKKSLESLEDLPKEIKTPTKGGRGKKPRN